MSTAHRTRQSMSFRQWNGNPCVFGAVALIDTVKRRPAVDPASSGDLVT